MQVRDKVKSFFSSVVHTEIGNGSSTLLWQDCWLQGKGIQDLAPNLISAVTKHKKSRKCSKGINRQQMDKRYQRHTNNWDLC
jgi:hypothetical protein